MPKATSKLVGRISGTRNPRRGVQGPDPPNRGGGRGEVGEMDGQAQSSQVGLLPSDGTQLPPFPQATGLLSLL